MTATPPSPPADHACRPGIPFSFELYPPKTDAAATALHGTIDALADARPEFISVTYGASGSSRTSSLDVLRYIRRATTVDPMAHLTCVGSSPRRAA
ncbi:methylenetetrahydrofolate reductase [Cryobacterium sp.]|jgi:methylenetetrahydrofolate reductase (NADPH)|uniref:methylenetetrahydrofolate reductase n=1 Tax=Cryobacterium sp. TaxID=1926290 RepID=UPI00262E91D3|nr:methylenetetrahydrofolate reductase [Cryobacterium sp.]MCU1447611.1 5,10-methylenetetrahydrofolate reductase [Cryobacterium sp.]